VDMVRVGEGKRGPIQKKHGDLQLTRSGGGGSGKPLGGDQKKKFESSWD